MHKDIRVFAVKLKYPATVDIPNLEKPVDYPLSKFKETKEVTLAYNLRFWNFF